MLKNILRIVLLAAVVIGVAWGLSWLISNGGEVPIQLNGKEYRPTLIAIVLAIVFGLVVFWLFVKLVELGLAVIGFLMGDKNAISKVFGKRRQKRGMDALETSMLALSAGESKTALQKAYRANKDLDRPMITNMMIAQAAKQEGKPKEVEAAYKSMLETSPAGRFVAIHGLMEQRAQAGDQETAAQLAKKALEIKPNDVSTINTLFDMQVKAQDWEGARQTLKSKVKAEKMPADVARRREAVLAISEAQSLDPVESKARYDELVALAYRLAPSLVPAATMAARASANAGNMRQANNIIIKAWGIQPHPDLAATFAELVPDETPEARLRRFKVLTKRQKDNPQTKMLNAELLLANEDFPGARRAMGNLADDPQTSRQLGIMAAIEHGEGADDTIVRAYLARAMQASRGEQWVCNNCHEVHGEWEAVCDNCQHFDTLDWKTPPESVDQDTGVGVLLPMLMSSSNETQVVEAADVEVEDAQVVEEKTA